MCFLWIFTPHCMWLCKKTKSCIYILLLHATCILGFGVVLECWPVRMSTRGSGVMRCDGMWMLLSLDLFITQPWLCDGMLYELCVSTICWYPLVFMCEVEVYVYETLNLTSFGVIDQWYLDYFPFALVGLMHWSIFDDVMLWHVLTWPFW